MSVKRLNAGPRMSGAVVNGNTVYVAGQVADGANVKAQTEAVLKKIDDLLGAAGSSKANLLSTVIYLSDIRTFDEMNAVWDAWVSPGNTPARATVEARLANPKYLVEIMVVAAVGVSRAMAHRGARTARSGPPIKRRIVMADAVIVSTARTPIGRAYRGAFNNTHGAMLGGHVIQHAVQRAGLEPGQVEDVILGCAMPEGATGHNIARQCRRCGPGCRSRRAASPSNRFCSSGLQAIAMAAQRVIVDRVPVMVAGGLESISLVQNEHMNLHRFRETLDGGAQARDLHVDDRDGRGRRQALLRHARDAGRVRAVEPAAHRGRPARGPLRRRDRPAADDEADGRQGHRRDA